ncbi:APC family permease [Flavimobilis sp. GY10621]|uniref:APC family permease n=1 Tax=Flavimobilis rhizosphaerae TaxID=2775421 RepID=A0ABR9DMT9_9MICO|nr:APC family permease [Flavimobilis rhizosphaerae]MBD9698445.1 APC family permease [Flavimobilis rhizosphaerae]
MTSAPLARRLGLVDAVTLGLGSMLGAGVFAALAPAAGLAGRWLLVALGLAALVATANALSTAQLAARHPVAGGAYAYGRARLGSWWGFLAGWGFVVGKTASCAAMALTLGAYAWPGHERSVALVAVVALVAIDMAGVTRTARATRVLLVVTLLALGALVVTVAIAAASGALAVGGGAPPTTTDDVGVTGVLGAAGLLFFALAGYARVATLGEEVRDPARTIPQAVMLALVGAVTVVAAVAAAALVALGPATLAASGAPLVDTAQAVDAGWLVPVVGVAAVTASGGALLALLAGVGRTTLAMAREGDLPRALAHVDARRRTPTTATLLVGTIVAVLVCTTDLRGMLGASSAGVLLYYGVANAAAWTMRPAERIAPRWVPAAGLVGCAALVASLPRDALVVAGAVLLVGLAGRALTGGVLRPQDPAA